MKVADKKEENELHRSHPQHTDEVLQACLYMTRGCTVNRACVGLSLPWQFRETLQSISLCPWEIKYSFQKHRLGLDAYKYLALALQWARCCSAPPASATHHTHCSSPYQSGVICHHTVSLEEKWCNPKHPLYLDSLSPRIADTQCFFLGNSSLITKWVFSLQIWFSCRIPPPTAVLTFFVRQQLTADA